MKKLARIFAIIAFVVALYGAATFALYYYGSKLHHMPEYELPDIYIKGE